MRTKYGENYLCQSQKIRAIEKGNAVVIKLKNLFAVTFGITIIARAMSLHEFKAFIPYTEIYFLFIIGWTMMLFMNRHTGVLYRTDGIKASVLLVLYFIIWGVSNMRNLDFTDTFETMIRSLMMMAFVIISSCWIRKLNCLHLAIKAAYISLTALLWVLFIAYIDEVNIAKTLSTFWVSEEWLRTRARFGLGNNIPAEYAMSVILMSIFLLQEEKKSGRPSTKRKLFIHANNLLMILVIIANNSRGTMIALIAMAAVYFLIKTAGRHTIVRMVEIAMVIIAVVAVGFAIGVFQGGLDITTLLGRMNRSHFLSNINALASSGRWMMGLGNISGEYFKNRNILYGVQLDYMEVGYVRYFVCSGIIGCIWLAYVVFLILRSAVKCIENNNTTVGKWILLIIVYMMFLNLFEEYMFSSVYITSSTFLCFIIANMNVNVNHVGSGRKRQIVIKKSTMLRRKD